MPVYILAYFHTPTLPYFSFSLRTPLPLSRIGQVHDLPPLRESCQLEGIHSAVREAAPEVEIVLGPHSGEVAVDPDFRRLGLARFLLREVMARVAEAGVISATLEVRPSNEAGRALYESLGFRVEGVRPGYYQNPREDGLVLWRRGLSPAPQAADG